MGKETLVKGEIEVDFSGDVRALVDFNREALTEFVNRFVKKYGEEREIFDISIYLKKLDTTYLNRPLVFCNIAANTEFGLATATSTGWGLKQSIRQGLRTLILEVHKLGEKDLFGEYASNEVLA